MSTLTMDDLVPGTSWGCRFRVNTFCNTEGKPVRAPNLQQGQAHPGTPQTYESWGVIKIRDLNNRRLTVIDHDSKQEFVVSEKDAWDYDTVEWSE